MVLFGIRIAHWVQWWCYELDMSRIRVWVLQRQKIFLSYTVSSLVVGSTQPLIKYVVAADQLPLSTANIRNVWSYISAVPYVISYHIISYHIISYHIYSPSVDLCRYGIRHTVYISMQGIYHNTTIQ